MPTTPAGQASPSSADLYPIERKAWGHSQRIAIDEDRRFEAVRICVLPGGYCSKHRHAQKDNSFWVIKGLLRVIVYLHANNGDGKQAAISHELGPSDAPFNVARGTWHQFESMGGAVVIEMYRAVEGTTIDGHCPAGLVDIERDEVMCGGRK